MGVLKDHLLPQPASFCERSSETTAKWSKLTVHAVYQPRRRSSSLKGYVGVWFIGHTAGTHLVLWFHQVLGTGAFGKVVRATWKKAPPPGDPVREVALKYVCMVAAS